MRTVLDNTKLAESATRAMASFHPEYVKEVEQAIQANAYVIVGMKQNPVVKKARRLLEEHKIAYKYIEHGSYFSKWRQRLAIKLWSGWPTFPMVFIDSKLIGGCKELKVYLENKKPN